MGAKCVLISFVIFVTVLLLLILVPLHFSYIERNNIGFKKNTATSAVDLSVVYPNGRYGWGISYRPVTFPSTYQLVKLTGVNSLSLFVEGGQTISVGFEFMYRLVPSLLPQLYKAFGTNYETRIVSFARARLRNTAPQFTLDDYLLRRANITNVFFADLQAELLESAFVQTRREFFFMHEVKLPSSLLTQRTQTAYNLQQQITQTYAQNASLIRVGTQQLVAQIDGQTVVVQQNATAVAAQLRSQAVSAAFSIVENAKAQMMKAIVDTLKPSPNATAELLYYLSILDSRGPTSPTTTTTNATNGTLSTTTTPGSTVSLVSLGGTGATPLVRSP